MKRLLGLVVLALGLALPAHAQFLGGSIGGGSSLNNAGGSSGGGFHASMSQPTRFATTGVSGTEADFIPSAFVSYDQAIAVGKAALAEKAKTVVNAAAENSDRQKPRAKLAMVQDANGNVILVSR
jgi:hypothetical protein